eukprot:Trichotokara_eunicae@DN9959_c0_g1_i1.p1
MILQKVFSPSLTAVSLHFVAKMSLMRRHLPFVTKKIVAPKGGLFNKFPFAMRRELSAMPMEGFIKNIEKENQKYIRNDNHISNENAVEEKKKKKKKKKVLCVD